DSVPCREIYAAPIPTKDHGIRRLIRVKSRTSLGNLSFSVALQALRGFRQSSKVCSGTFLASVDSLFEEFLAEPHWAQSEQCPERWFRSGPSSRQNRFA